jgi:hypothetical protein
MCETAHPSLAYPCWEALALIGTSTNIAVNGLLQAYKMNPRVFEYTHWPVHISVRHSVCGVHRNTFSPIARKRNWSPYYIAEAVV